MQLVIVTESTDVYSPTAEVVDTVHTAFFDCDDGFTCTVHYISFRINT